jgi:hypothetical protein
MEPTQLQLVINVITITGAASLAGYCYLLKKENRKLATQREASKAEVVQTAVHPQTAAPSAKPAKTVDVDIRTFASARRNRWVSGLASSISR